MRLKLPSKLKIGGGLLVLAILAGLYARAEFWKGKHAKAEGALIEMKVEQISLKRELSKAKTLAMTPREIEEKIKVIYVKEGEVAKVTGFIANKKQVADCKACMDGQKLSDETLAEALTAQKKAQLREDLAIRRKKKWKGAALIGIPLGILGGYALSEAF